MSSAEVDNNIADNQDTMDVNNNDFAQEGQMSIEEALEDVIRRSLIHDGLVRGTTESIKTIDKKQAQLCILAECEGAEEITKLTEALCQERSANLIKISDRKKLGSWCGLCKIDREGNARRIRPTTMVVIRDYGEESQAKNILLEHIKSQ